LTYSDSSGGVDDDPRLGVAILELRGDPSEQCLHIAGGRRRPPLIEQRSDGDGLLAELFEIRYPSFDPFDVAFELRVVLAEPVFEQRRVAVDHVQCVPEVVPQHPVEHVELLVAFLPCRDVLEGQLENWARIGFGDNPRDFPPDLVAGGGLKLQLDVVDGSLLQQAVTKRLSLRGIGVDVADRPILEVLLRVGPKDLYQPLVDQLELTVRPGCRSIDADREVLDQSLVSPQRLRSAFLLGDIDVEVDILGGSLAVDGDGMEQELAGSIDCLTGRFGGDSSVARIGVYRAIVSC